MSSNSQPRTYEECIQHVHSFEPAITERLLTGRRTSRGDDPYDFIASMVAGTPTRVLDVGCGSGRLLESVAKRGSADRVLIGVDRSGPELAMARRRLITVAPVQGDAVALPVSDRSIDLVIFHLSLLVVGSIERSIDEARRILKPSGQLIAAVPGVLRKGSHYRAVAKIIEPQGGHAIMAQAQRHGIQSAFRSMLVRRRSIRVVPYSIFFSGVPEKVAMDIVAYFYSSRALTAVRRKRIEGDVAVYLRRVGRSCRVTLRIPHRAVIIGPEESM